MEAHQHPLWIAESRLSRVQAHRSRPGEVPAAGPKGHALRSFLAEGAPRKMS